MARENRETVGDIEERYINAIYRIGINLGVFVMGAASVIAFLLAFVRLIVVIASLFGVRSELVQNFLGTFGV